MKNLLLLFIVLCSINVFSQEGTKQLRPNETDTVFLQLFNETSNFNFAGYDQNAADRVYIYLNSGEKLYFGFRSFDLSDTIKFRLKDQNENVVFDETDFPTSGAGYIANYSEAVNGPEGVKINGTTIPASDGYTPFVYEAVNSGNHYIEFKFIDSNKFTISEFDFTVTDSDDNVVTNPNDPNKSAGRLWAYGWALTTWSFDRNPIQNSFYILTADEFVNQIYPEMKPFGFFLMSNSYGISDDSTINQIERAQSVEGLVSTAELAEHKIFFNDPDHIVFSSTTLPPPIIKVWFEDSIVYDYSYSRESQELAIEPVTFSIKKNSVSCPYTSIGIFELETNISGFTSILMDIDGGGYSTDGGDRSLEVNLNKGMNYILWDFKDDDSNIVADGNYTASATFLGRGPTHFPLYDVESVSGFTTKSIRPFNRINSTLYWDESKISDNLWGDTLGAMDETKRSQLVIGNDVPRLWTYYHKPDNGHSRNGDKNTWNTWYNAIDQGLSSFSFNVSQSDVKCVNGEAPILGDVYLYTEPNSNIVFKTSNFSDKFFNAKRLSITYLKIHSLPLNGILRLSGIPVTAGDSIIAANISKLVFSPNTDYTGTTTFEWNASNGSYYSENSDTVFLTFNSKPTISKIQDTTICTNTLISDIPFTINDSETSASDLVVYAFSNDVDVVGNSNFTIGGSGSNRTLTFSPNTNKSGSAIIYVVVNDGYEEVIEQFTMYISPSIEVIGDSTVCFGSNLNLTANEIGADSYAWIFKNDTINTSRNLVISNLNTDSIGSYKITIEKDGCTVSDSFGVVLAPISSFAGDTLICKGETLSLSANETVASLYNWKIGNSIISTSKILSTDTFSVTRSNYSLYLEKEGCTNQSDSFTISVVPIPDITLDISGDSIKIGDDGTITIISSESGFYYQAYLGSDSVGTTRIGTGSNLDITISSADLSNGSNNINVQVRNTNCELNMDSVPVIYVNLPPVISFTNPIIDENNTYVETVTATDPDVGDSKTFLILGGADQSKFYLDSTNGNLSFIVPPDYDIPGDANGNNIYEVDIIVVDSRYNKDTANIIVSISGLIDNNPIITTIDTTIKENYTFIETINATDADVGDTILYSISGGADQSKFYLDSTNGNLSFILPPNFEKPSDSNIDNIYEVEITVTDEGFNIDKDTLYVTVKNINDRPQANNDSIVINEDIDDFIDVLLNDDDGDNNIITTTIVINPVFGSATVINMDSIFYSPNDNYNGKDTLTYFIFDGALRDTAKVFITINPVDDPPEAIDDTINTPVLVDTSLVIDVCSGFNENDGDSTNFAIECDASNGSLELVGCDLIYVPDSGFSGFDTVCYTVCDDDTTNLCDTITVIISVDGGDGNLLLIADTLNAEVLMNNSIEIYLCANYNDVEIDSNISIDCFPLHGVALISDCILTYTPNASYLGADTICYTVCHEYDSTFCETGVIVMDVKSNLTPIIINDTLTTIDIIDEEIVIDICTNINEDYQNQTNSTLSCQPSNGNAVIDGCDLTYIPDSGFVGNDTLCYEICSDIIVSLCSTVVIIITVDDSIPNVVISDTIIAIEINDSTYEVDVCTNVNEGGAPGTDLSIGCEPSNGNVIINGCKITYEPDSGFVGYDTICYIACNNNYPPQCDTGFIIIPVNGPLVIEDTIKISDVITGDITINVCENIKDSIVKNPIITIECEPSNGVVTQNGCNLTYEPDNNFFGIDTICYIVCNGLNPPLCDTAIIIIPVEGSLVVEDTLEISEVTGSEIIINVCENIYDSLSSNITLSCLPSNGTVKLNGCDIIYTPNNGFIGNDTICYIVCNNQIPEHCDTVVMVIPVDKFSNLIAAVNDTITINKYRSYDIPVLENDINIIAGVKVNIVDQIIVGLVEVLESNEIKYTPTTVFDGTHTLFYNIINNNDTSNTAKVVIIFSIVNQAPVSNADSIILSMGKIGKVDLFKYVADIDYNLDISTINSINNTTTAGAFISVLDGSADIHYDSIPIFFGRDSLFFIAYDSLYAYVIDTLIIHVNSEGATNFDKIIVPNTFSPNGDGHNDEFVIPDIDEYKDNELLVFNRWGSLVYSTLYYKNDWDGKLQDSEDLLPSGVYYYVLRLTSDINKAKKGFVYITR